MVSSPPTPSLAMLTDLYELTMAAGYHALGRADEEAVFNLFFREPPFASGYTLVAGLDQVLDLVADFRFDADDVAYLRSLAGADGSPLFNEAFLGYLSELRLSVDIAAIPEGTVVFPHQPLLRVTGSIIQCQLLESALLNLINFQTLIATKAARVVTAAQGDPVLEFGLRRAQGIDGALAASRAAFIGGCSATSNVLAGKRYGIPVRGTHAHSWVMSFDDELESFEAYARALPNNCVFLVDTYDTLEGVKKAVAVGRALRRRGHELVGIRLDSGDLAQLSIAARELLDAAGFADTNVIASNDLDEHLIADLKQRGAAVAVWGVGTRMVTAFDQPALGGVYKLAALRSDDGSWQPVIKLSEDPVKVSTPGMLQVRRFANSTGFIGDATYDALVGIGSDVVVVDPMQPQTPQVLTAATTSEDLLVPVVLAGQLCYERPSVVEIQSRAATQLAQLPAAITQITPTQRYVAGLEQALYQKREQLVRTWQGGSE